MTFLHQNQYLHETECFKFQYSIPFIFLLIPNTSFIDDWQGYLNVFAALLFILEHKSIVTGNFKIVEDMII